MKWDKANADEMGMRVSWDLAKFEDNSGDPPTIDSKPPNTGSHLQKGINRVRYCPMVSITLVIYFTELVRFGTFKIQCV